MTNITKKINAIKDSAKQNLTDADDFFNEVKGNLFNVEAIREKNKLHNDGKSQLLLEEFYKTKKELNEKVKADSEYTIANLMTDLKSAYLKYAQKNAKLDRLGKATVFLDATTDSYVIIERFKDKDRFGNEHDRILNNRISNKVLGAFIDDESKKIMGALLKGEQVGFIKRELNAFYKEFEPLKEKFYGRHFNTYTPHGFLDVRVNNKVNIEKFVNISMPKRYPIINALMENIAPASDERIYLLNWFSTILNTSQKTKTAPVLKGIQRTGKGVFATQIIEYAMHESNCFIATNSNLADNFNGYLEDKLFITFDEVKGDFKTDKDIGNKIKQIVSEDKYQIRTMHTNPYMITLHCNCIFLSNDDLPIPMDQSDGRFTIIETKARKLIDVAETDFKMNIEEFLQALKLERDNFLVHLKMCNFDKKLAMSTIENKSKKVIQDAVATHEAVLKTAFKNQDAETVSDILDEAIQDILGETLIKKEYESFARNEDTGDQFKAKRQVPFNHTNFKMKEIFMKEFKAGYMSNTALKWFSKSLNLEHILKDDKKFGSFWNKVLTGGVTINLKQKAGISNTNPPRLKEKFRQLKTHEVITSFHFDDKDFTFVSTTTAEQL
jgi:hypothetical protein